VIQPGSFTETLGGPDVTHVFVHATTSFDQPAYLRLTGPAVERWAERALLLARCEDVVCLAAPVEEAYLAWLQDLGIGVAASRIVVPNQFDADAGDTLPVSLMNDATALGKIATLAGNTPRIVVNPYLGSRAEFELATCLSRTIGRHVEVLAGSVAATERANSKQIVRAMALRLGIPVADGEVIDLGRVEADRPANSVLIRSAVDRWLNRTGAVIVRACVASSGSGTSIVRHGMAPGAGRFDTLIRETRSRYFLVETLVEPCCSPNILMDLPREAPPVLVGASDPRLDPALSYQGNVFPSRARTLDDMIAGSATLASALRREGLVGPVGFDFVEYREPRSGRRRLMLAEVNPRINGAHYSTSLVERLNAEQARTGRPAIRACLTARVTTTARSFAEFQRRYAPLLFDRASGSGIVPFSTGRLSHGRCNIAVLGAADESVEALYGELMANLEREATN
jgi:hypothetical protein